MRGSFDEEDDGFSGWAVAEPVAAPVAQVAPHAHLNARQALPEDIFCEEEAGGDWGDFEGPVAAAAPQIQPRHQQQQPAQQLWQQAAPLPLAPPPVPQQQAGLHKGAPVWLWDARSNSWVEARASVLLHSITGRAVAVLLSILLWEHRLNRPAPTFHLPYPLPHVQVVLVDISISPPSYGVELLGNGSFRETEEHRLRPRLPGVPPPAAAATAAAAAVPAAGPANRHVPDYAAGGFYQQPPAVTAAAADYDFGDFAAAPAVLPSPPTLAAAAAPLAAPAAAHAHAAPASPRLAGRQSPRSRGQLHPHGSPPRSALSSRRSSGGFFGSPACSHSVAVLPAGWSSQLLLVRLRTQEQRRTDLPPPAALLPSFLHPPAANPAAHSSPALDSFRAFLHAAAPQVSEQLELEEAAEEAREAAEEQRHADYGALQEYAASHLPASPRGSSAAAAGGAIQATVPAAAAAAGRGGGGGFPVPGGGLPAASPFASSAPLPHANPEAAPAAGWGEEDFGDWAAAAAGEEEARQLAEHQARQPPPLQQPEHLAVPLAALVPAGVQRDAPLPLDLFAEEPSEEDPAAAAVAAAGGVQMAVPAAAAVAIAAALEPPAAGAAAPAAPVALPHPPQQQQEQPWQQQQQQHMQQQPAAPRPTTMFDPAGRRMAVDYPEQFMRTPPQLAAAEHQPDHAAAAASAASAWPAAATAGTAAVAADGWGDEGDDEFADFVAPEPAAAGPIAGPAALQPAPVGAEPEQQQPAEAAPSFAARAALPAATAAVATAAAAVVAGGWEGRDSDDFANFTAAPAAQSAAAQPEATAEQQQQQQADDAVLTTANKVNSPAGAEQANGSLPLEDTAMALDDPSWDAAAVPALDLPQQQQQQPASPPGSVGSTDSRHSALLSALHPMTSRGGSARSSLELPAHGSSMRGSLELPAPPSHSQWQGLPASSFAAGSSRAAGPAAGEEAVTEYAVAWARLLQVRFDLL